MWYYVVICVGAFLLAFRYSALKALGERKQAFNEYVQARRNEEKEEERRRLRQAREDFVTMLTTSDELKVRCGVAESARDPDADPYRLKLHAWL